MEEADLETIPPSVSGLLSSARYAEFFMSTKLITAMFRQQAKELGKMDMAKDFTKTMKESISSVDLSITRHDNNDLISMTNQVARNLVSGIESCIAKGGRVLAEIFKWNFDLDGYQNVFSEENNNIGAQIEVIDRNIDEIDASKPDIEMSLSAEDLQRQEEMFNEAEEQAHNAFETRIASASSARGSTRRNAASETAETFEGSEEFRQFLVKSDTIKGLFQHMSDKAYRKLNMKYRQALEVRKKLVAEKKKLDDDRTINVIISYLVSNYVTAVSLIVQKIRNVVKDYPDIESKLSGHVTILRTGQHYTNPYSNPTNLTAIYEILIVALTRQIWYHFALC